jgi:hypothetical protein
VSGTLARNCSALIALRHRSKIEVRGAARLNQLAHAKSSASTRSGKSENKFGPEALGQTEK